MNKKLEMHRELIEDCIAKEMPIEHAMNITSISFSTIKKYFPHYCGNKRRTKDLLAEREYNKNPKCCLTCNKQIPWQMRKRLKYCNHSCAAKTTNIVRNVNIVYREMQCCECGKSIMIPPSNIRKTIWCSDCDVNRVKISLQPRKIISCACCGKKTKNAKFCTTACWLSSINQTKTDFEQYAKQCKFKFNVYEYPNFFDLMLIEQHGWYSPSNKNNNLNGVSRDHCFSIKRGFEESVDPAIISHPANCKLVLHKDNQRKNRNCSITLDQLKQNIHAFNDLYNYIIVFNKYDI